MAEATAHLPAHQPKAENEMPQGKKNWDKPPQQVDGPEGPEPLPHPQDVSSANRRVSKAKKPQQVDGPEGPTPPEPHGATHSDDKPPQTVDGPEGPIATDGTELNDAVASQNQPADEPVKAPAKKAPAKAAASAKTGSK